MKIKRLIIFIFLLVSFTASNATVYYVSPTGNDSNPGTFASPWKTWGKAFNASLIAGDTVMFRGGTYLREFGGDPSWYSTYWKGYMTSLQGTKANPIVFMNYPGEIPVLDGTGTYMDGMQKNGGLIISSTASNLHLKGLHIKSIEQVTTIQEDVNGLISSGSSIILEQLSIYDIDGAAYVIGPVSADTTWIINCDAYFCIDSLGDQHEQPTNPRPGDDGSGFRLVSATDSGAVIIAKGSRAWFCGDQGFSIGSVGTTIIDSCWSFQNGDGPPVSIDGVQISGYGGGHGFKAGWTRHKAQITNSLIINNEASGITTNEDYLAAGGTVCADSLLVYNNLIYNNLYGVRVDAYPDVCDNPALNELNRVFKNNIVYDNTSGDMVPTHDATYTHEYNSFDITGLTVTDSDFISISKDSATVVSTLSAARKADGSLPEIGDYYQLAPASPMVDAGVDVGIDYIGTAPDLGSFEYDPNNIYYVSTDGSDSNPGTIDEPWLSWEYAFEELSPGDLLYIRGGTYYKANNGGVFDRVIITGTITDSIYIFNYPGEKPILDFRDVTTSTREDSWGMVTETYYVHFKGLTMQNFYERDDDDFMNMWQMHGTNTVIENCVTRWGGGRGWRAYQVDQFYYINCDAYMHVDSLSPSLPGNDGYGFSSSILDGDSIFYYGCRAWDCGDDGFTSGSGTNGYAEYINCWSFDNGELEGGGSGWKLNGSPSEATSGINRLVANSIAAYNADVGFTTNDQGDYAYGLNIYNNTAYHNGYQGTPYWGAGAILFNSLSDLTRESDRIFKNNIFYDNQRYVVWVESGSTYTHSYNDWDLGSVTITDADFVSLDSTGLRGPRQADGSLPDIDFLKLAATSNAIDAGDDEGYGDDLGARQFIGTSTPTTPSADYYVSPDGNDNNPGTFEQPWATWDKAFNHTLVAGDTVMFRGGVYYNTANVDEKTGITGTRDNPIVFINYPGETPILDGSTRTTPGSGLVLYYAEYVNLIGLTVRNQPQIVGYPTENLYVNGIYLYLCKHVTIERCVVHDTGRRGFSFYAPDTLYVTDCDSYNNADALSPEPGQGADGFIMTGGGDTIDYARFTRCRSWYNSDDGWDVHTHGYIEFENCYSFLNGYLEYGNGVGFKLNLSIELHRDMLSRKVFNSVAAFNSRTGFSTNDTERFPIPTHIYNNTSYSNNEGYIAYNTSLAGVTTADKLRREFKNNISYSDGVAYQFFGDATHEYNTWNTPPGITVTAADFVSLDSTGLTAPRQADGSFPDNNAYTGFLHLTENSDLRDIGLSLGYGTDLGAFQYSYVPTPIDPPIGMRTLLKGLNGFKISLSGRLLKAIER